jgi:hypothetical protein
MVRPNHPAIFGKNGDPDRRKDRLIIICPQSEVPGSTSRINLLVLLCLEKARNMDQDLLMWTSKNGFDYHAAPISNI